MESLDVSLEEDVVAPGEGHPDVVVDEPETTHEDVEINEGGETTGGGVDDGLDDDAAADAGETEEGDEEGDDEGEDGDIDTVPEEPTVSEEDLGDTLSSIEGLSHSLEQLDGMEQIVETHGLTRTSIECMSLMGLLTSSVATDTLEFASESMSDIAEENDAYLDIAQEGIIGSVIDKLGAWAHKAMDMAGGLVTKATGMVKAAFSKVMDVVKRITGGAWDAAKNIGEKMKEHPVATVVGAVALLGGAAAIISMTAATLPAAVAGGAATEAAAGAKVAETVAKVASSAGKVGGKVAEKATYITAKGKKYFGEAGLRVKAFMNRGALVPQKPVGMAALGGSAGSAGASASAAANAAKAGLTRGSAGGWTKNVVTSIGSGLSRAFSAIVSAIRSMGAAISTSVKFIVGKVKSGGEWLWNGAKGTVSKGGAVNTAYRKTKLAGTQAVRGAKGLANKGIDAAKGSVAKGGALNNAYRQAKIAGKKGWSGAVSCVTRSVRFVWDTLKSLVFGTFGLIASALSALASCFRSGAGKAAAAA